MRCHMKTTILKPSQKPKAKAKSQAKSRKPKAESQKPKAKSQKPKAKSQKPKAKSRKPKAKSQKPKAESRKPKAKSQNQRCWLQNATKSMQIRDVGSEMQQIARKTAPDWKQKNLSKKTNILKKIYPPFLNSARITVSRAAEEVPNMICFCKRTPTQLIENDAATKW